MFSGLTNPTVVRFASDGRVFVAEKSGLIKVFDSMSDTTPTVFANLSTNTTTGTHGGLLGMALDPNLRRRPTCTCFTPSDRSARLAESAAPLGDTCPNPPGGNSDGCVVSGRLSRLEANGNVMMGSEQVLVEDWCQQYPSHSIGTLEFGPDGALYASRRRSQLRLRRLRRMAALNPCGDPPGGVGAVLTPPTAKGVRFALADLRTSGDAVSLDGSIIRVDPATVWASPPILSPETPMRTPGGSSPMACATPSASRSVRERASSGSPRWAGTEWEEINRILDPADAVVENFGWPCWKLILASQATTRPTSPSARPCTATRAPTPSPTSPTTTGQSRPRRGLSRGNSSVSGIDFESALQASSYPPDYQGALLRRLHARLHLGDEEERQSDPVAGKHHNLRRRAANPVNIEFGPDGNLYYVDFDGGTIRKVEPAPLQPPPSAYLSDLTWTSMTNGFGPVEKDQSNGEFPEGDGGPLTLNGTTYPKGLGAHAASDVRYYLGGGCSRFTSKVGWTMRSVHWARRLSGVDSTKIYDSGLMTGTTATKTVDVSGGSKRASPRRHECRGQHRLRPWRLGARPHRVRRTDTTPPTVVATTPPTAPAASPAASPRP